MRVAEAGQHTSVRKNAAAYRIGLQVSLLAMRPLRMRNFALIRIGRHLVRDGDRWQFRFEGTETKNHRPIEVPIPEELSPSLERYLAIYRPLLAGAHYHGDRLWIGSTASRSHLATLAGARHQSGFWPADQPASVPRLRCYVDCNSRSQRRAHCSGHTRSRQLRHNAEIL